jgi:Family of unknown function (DUF5832)
MEESEENKVIDSLKYTDVSKAELDMIDKLTTAKSLKKVIEEDDIKPIGLNDELPEDEYIKAVELTREIMTKRNDFDIEKNLRKDILTIPGQKYCVVSWVGPTFRAKTDLYGFRIMGAFEELKEAIEYAKYVNGVDSAYDVGIMEMYLWCYGYPSDTDHIYNKDGSIDPAKTSRLMDEGINKFVVKHKYNLEKSKQLFEIRKRAVRKSNMTKERELSEGEDPTFLGGKPTEEMKQIHSDHIKKLFNEDEKEDENQNKKKSTNTYEHKAMLNFDCTCKLPCQEYAIVSFLGNDGTNGRIPISIKGVFATEKEANERIKQIMNVNDTYDIVPMPLYKWVPCNPDLTNIKEIYKNDNLNKLFNKDDEIGTMTFHQMREDMMSEDKTLDHATASKLLDDIDESDAELIRMKCKMYFEKKEEDDDEEGNYTIIDPSTKLNKHIRKFENLENNIKELESKIKNLMETEGISEKEASAKLRVSTERITEEEKEEIDYKPSKEVVRNNFDSLLEKLEYLKTQGYSKDDIRKIMSE